MPARHDDRYDPEPDYDRPTLADEYDDEPVYGRAVEDVPPTPHFQEEPRMEDYPNADLFPPFDPDEEEDYPEGMGHRQDTWPDLDDECERHIKAAFATLNRAPGQRETYARVQNKLAEAVRILRGER